MATRSTISYQFDHPDYDTPVFKTIYCHWDGYLSHNGAILVEHYNTLDKVIELVEGGNLSFLAPNCSKPEGDSFDTPVKGYCVYYGRDRGEENQGAWIVMTEEQCHTEEYSYIFKNGNWYVNGSKTPLTLEDCKAAD